MTSLACWRCRSEERPPEGCERLALCLDHLREQVRLAMGLDTAPSLSTERRDI